MNTFKCIKWINITVISNSSLNCENTLNLPERLRTKLDR